MECDAFDSLTRFLTGAQPRSMTRRGITRLLGGLALGGPLTLLGFGGRRQEKVVPTLQEAQARQVQGQEARWHPLPGWGLSGRELRCGCGHRRERLPRRAATVRDRVHPRRPVLYRHRLPDWHDLLRRRLL